jgi:hypothetical protein
MIGCVLALKRRRGGRGSSSGRACGAALVQAQRQNERRAHQHAGPCQQFFKVDVLVHATLRFVCPGNARGRRPGRRFRLIRPWRGWSRGSNRSARKIPVPFIGSARADMPGASDRVLLPPESRGATCAASGASTVANCLESDARVTPLARVGNALSGAELLARPPDREGPQATHPHMQAWPATVPIVVDGARVEGSSVQTCVA